MVISSSFWIPVIANWLNQQEETHPKSTDLASVARDILSIILHGVGVVASFSPGWDIISRWPSKPTGKTIHGNVITTQFAWADIRTLAHGDAVLDNMNAENYLDMKGEVEQQKFHRMGKVHDFLEIWQGSQNLWATEKESRTQNTQMTAVG